MHGFEPFLTFSSAASSWAARQLAAFKFELDALLQLLALITAPAIWNVVAVYVLLSWPTTQFVQIVPPNRSLAQGPLLLQPVPLGRLLHPVVPVFARWLPQ